MISALIVTVFVIWQSLILANQLPLPGIKRALVRTRLRLFPEWQMFTGPQIHLRLFLRGRRIDGTLDDWEEIQTAMHNSLLAAIWNPRWDHFWHLHYMAVLLVKRQTKVESCGRSVKELMPYKGLVHFAREHFRQREYRALQFRLQRARSHVERGQDEIIFESEFVAHDSPLHQ